MEEIERRVDAHGLVEFIGKSPSMFHAVASMRERLDEAGAAYLPEAGAWDLEPSRTYYTTRNGSSLIAWRVGDNIGTAGEGERSGRAPYSFQVCASHSDSPAFKLKKNCELAGPGSYMRLDTEAYGGMIDYTWFDRPLSVAGRVLVARGGRVESRLVRIDEPVAIIPSLAIHMNREMNKSFAPNRASDLFAMVSAGAAGAGTLLVRVAEAAGARPEEVVGHDLFLVGTEPGRVWGMDEEFVSSPRLDDLMCAYTSLEAFLDARNPDAVTVFVCFDNEEVGSGTKQGADSTFMAEALARINRALGYAPDVLPRALSASFMVSCDNAHAQHPAHPELADQASAPRLNAGLVVKEAANQHYCTDGFSRAVFEHLLDREGLAHQAFANRSDMAGGSTLGNISNAQVSMHAVDVGCAQLAMHSSYETAGAHDVALAFSALRAFYRAHIVIDGADTASIA